MTAATNDVVLENSGLLVDRGVLANQTDRHIPQQFLNRRAASSRDLLKRAARTLVVFLATGFAVVSVFTSRLNFADDPAPVPTQVEQLKVKSSPIHAKVVDVDGQCLEGVEVVVFQDSVPASKLKTNSDGLVVLNKTRFQEWFTLLSRRGDGFAGFSHYGGTQLEGGTAENPLVLNLTTEKHKITGSVVDPRGRPILGVRVFGRSLTLDKSSFFLSRAELEKQAYPLGSCVTDAAGRYKLTVPGRADVTLGFLHRERVSPWIVVPESVETVEPITLQPGGRITGKVTDAKTGAPVSEAEVSVQFVESPSETNGGGGESTSDAEGTFAIDGLEPGVYSMCLDRVQGRIQATVRGMAGIRVRSGEDARVELKVFDGIPLQGVVIDPSTNQGVPDGWVWCRGPAQPNPGSSFDMRFTDEHGRFTFFVHPGENSVFLNLTDRNRSSRLGRATVFVPENGRIPPIRLVAPGPERTQVAMNVGGVKSVLRSRVVRPTSVRIPPNRPEGRTVIGQVLEADGRPLVGATISTQINAEGGQRSPIRVVSDRDGIFIARGLPAGDVTMVATRPIGRDSLTQVVPGDRGEVEFTFGPAVAEAGQRTGQTVPPSDEPIPTALKARLTFVNLDSIGNDFLADGPGGLGDDLNRMAQGTHALDGAFYRIGEKLVHVRARPAPGLSDIVRAIAVGAKANQVRFLHSARGELRSGTEVGFYAVHYTDGTSECVPIVFGRDLGNWFSAVRRPLVTPTHARVAWTGTNDMADRSPPAQIKIHLYGSTWKNPHPERQIATIDVRSSSDQSELVVVGVTLERE
jgi:Carboxypeptidase regulatory-like domain